MFERPHYRSGTFQNDCVKNLRDVALPGSGVPLSVIAKSKILTVLFLVFMYPMIAFISAVNACLQKDSSRSVGSYYIEQLVNPQDW